MTEPGSSEISVAPKTEVSLADAQRFNRVRERLNSFQSTELFGAKIKIKEGKGATLVQREIKKREKPAEVTEPPVAPPTEVTPPTEEGEIPVAPPEPKPVGPPPPPPPPVTPVEPLRNEFDVVLFGDTHRVVDEERRGVPFQMKLAQETSQSALGMAGRSVKNILSGIYQRTLLQPWFEEREARWRRVVLDKTGLAHLPDKLVEEAMKKGKGELRNKRNPVRRMVDRIYNFGANLVAVNTTDQIDGQKWLVEQIEKAKKGEEVEAVVKESLLGSSKEKEACGQRLSLGVAQKETLYKDEVLNPITDGALNKQLVADMFKLLTPYISGNISEEQALRLMEQYCDGGITVGSGELLRLRDRLKDDQYQYLRRHLTTVGSNMRRVAQILAKKDQDGLNRYQKQGKVENAGNAESWIKAYNDGNIKLNFFVAEAEMTPGARRETPVEKAARLLRARSERYPAITGSGVLGRAANWLEKMTTSFALNEISVAYYSAAFLQSLIPTTPTKVGLLAGVFGLPTVPILIATTTAGLPVAVPLAAGSAASAGIFAGVREALRARRELKSVEWEASVGKVDPEVRINAGPLHRFFRGIYGATGREELLKKIAHQREASQILNGLTVESGLFSQSTDLTSKMPANISEEQVKKALRWYNEYKVRTDAEVVRNRRFLRFNEQLSESQQREVLAGTAEEVFERLTAVFGQREDLRNQFFREGVNNLGELCNKLQEAYRCNLLGGRQKPSRQTEVLVALLGATDEAKGFIKENENLSRRNWAAREMYFRKFLHRGAGTVLTGLVGGEIAAEVSHWIRGTPPSEIIGGMLGEWRGTPEVTADMGSSPLEIAGLHLRLPRGFNYDQTTHELVSPGGPKINLDVNGDGMVDKNELLQGLNLAGITKIQQITKEALFSQPTHEQVFGPTTIKLPGEVHAVDIDGNKLIDHIDLHGKSIDLKAVLGHEINPGNKGDLEVLRDFLSKNGIDNPTLQETISTHTEVVTNPAWVTALERGQEVFGENGVSFKLANGMLHVYDNGKEILTEKPIMAEIVGGKVFGVYQGVEQNTVPSNFLDAITKAGAGIKNTDFWPPRISNADWGGYLKSIGGKIIIMDETVGTPTVPPVPWPATPSGEHFPYTNKAFEHFFEGGRHVNAEHVFTDGSIGLENGQKVIQWDNGAVSYPTEEMASAYEVAKNTGLKEGDGWVWVIQRPAPPGENFNEGFNAAIISNGKVEVDVDPRLVGRVWASFGYLDKQGIFHKIGGYGPTENLRSLIDISRQVKEYSYLLDASKSQTIDVTNFAVPEQPGEFVIGVMPLAYTDYAQLGKIAAASQPTPPPAIDEALQAIYPPDALAKRLGVIYNERESALKPADKELVVKIRNQLEKLQPESFEELIARINDRFLKETAGKSPEEQRKIRETILREEFEKAKLELPPNGYDGFMIWQMLIGKTQIELAREIEQKRQEMIAQSKS